MKKLFCVFCLVVLLVSSFSGVAGATPGPEISAKSSIVIDAQTGKILYEKNSYKKMPMASTTKIMSTLLALENGNLEKQFVVDSNAIKVEGSSMGLIEGDIVTQRDLCYGMMLPSGNDAANATAVNVAGDIDSFVEKMNERATKIGMKNTHFVTPSGLDDYTDDHYSTSYDMSLLAKEAMKNDEFREICSTQTVKLHFGNPPYDRWLTNTNKLLKYCDGAIGIKTGFTDKARRCLVSACKRNDITLICVTLNAPNDWQDHKTLYDYCFTMEKRMDLPYDNPVSTINVVGGEKDYAYIRLERSPSVSLVPGDENKIVKKVFVPPFIYAPLFKGNIVGEVRYYLNGTEVDRVKLVSADDIMFKKIPHEKSLFERLIDIFR